MRDQAREATNSFLESLPVEQRSVGALLAAAAAERPSRMYYTWNGKPFTLGDVDRRATRLAAGLLEAGVEPGAAVAVLMDNSPRYLDVWFALSKIGAIEVPINTAFRGELLCYQLDNARAGVVIVDSRYRDAVHRVSADASLRILEASELPHAEGSVETVVDVAAVGAVLYTSGTTGPSKGVMLSHHQQTSFGIFYSQIAGVEADDVVLNYLPHFHIAGKFLSISCLLTGARMVLRERLSVSGF